MKLSFKRKLAGLLGVVLAFSIILGGQAATFVKAEGGSGNLTFSYDDSSLGFGEIQWKASVDDEWHTQQEAGTVSATAVRIKYSNGGVLAGHTELRVDGEAILAANKAALESDAGLALEEGKNYSFEHIQFVDGSSSGGGDEDNPPREPEIPFDGIAYFVWQGADDALCIHKITGLEESRSQGEIIAFDIIYIPVSEVKDDVTGEQFIIGNKNYYWLWSSAEQFMQENNASYSTFNAALTESEDVLRRFAIDPCGAENGESTVCTNGDRTFRATIYDNTTYEGVAFSQNENDYTYFPSFWDNVFFTNTVDISETTVANPAVYESFLLEPTIHFGKADNSVNEFTGIRALDVPDGAVAITGDAASGYDIEFGSNFFDNVVFEITTANGNYYMEIARTAIQVFDINGPEEENPQVVAKIFYDENESYTDYEVYATIHYKDGNVSVQKIAVSEITDDGFGNTPAPGTYEMEAGKGLKSAQYSVPLTDDIEGIDFNAVKSGALSGTTYGGSYFGSGNGVYYDVETRRIKY